MKTFRGIAMHMHLSMVIMAVIQLVTRVKIPCGQDPDRYWTSIGSKVKSSSLNAGIRQMFAQTRGTRDPKSDTARPEMSFKVKIRPVLQDTRKLSSHYPNLKIEECSSFQCRIILTMY